MINTLRGALVLIFLTISILFFSSLIVLLAIPFFLIPNAKWRLLGKQFLQKIPIWWMEVNNAILKINCWGKLIYRGNADLKTDGWYMVVSNHQTWVDILLVSLALHQKTPLLKFFMKKELLWSLPIAGFACAILGYPFLERQKRSDIRKNPELKNKDVETTRKACEKFKEIPTSVMSFAEGTRFTSAKQANQSSPYKNLLKPRAGGTAIVLNELRDKLDGLIDITIFYDKPNLSLWDFACGNFEKIVVEYQLIKLDENLFGNYYEDRAYRARFTHWLNELWAEKDLRLDELKQEFGD